MQHCGSSGGKEEEEEGGTGAGRAVRKEEGIAGAGMAAPNHCGNGWLPFLSHHTLRHVELLSA